MEKIKSTYQYVFFRLLLFHRKQWEGSKTVGSFNSHAAITGSGIALIFSIDLIYSIFVRDEGLINGPLAIGMVCLSVIIIQNILLPKDDEKLIQKYSDQQKSDPYWKTKGYLSLSFVFGPLILMFILMWALI